MGVGGSKVWDNKMPDDLTDKVVIITGANSGTDAFLTHLACFDGCSRCCGH